MVGHFLLGDVGGLRWLRLREQAPRAYSLGPGLH